MGELEISKIEKVLDERVRPNLAQHGGDIEIEKLEDGVLHVRMHGQCSGCSFCRTDVGKSGQHRVKRSDFRNWKDVVLVTGVSDDLIAQARQIPAAREKKRKNRDFLQADCMRKR